MERKLNEPVDPEMLKMLDMLVDYEVTEVDEEQFDVLKDSEELDGVADAQGDQNEKGK